MKATYILKIIAAVFIFSFVLIFSGAIFTVKEGQSALILRLGKIAGMEKGKDADLSVVLQPGLHLKLPFIDQVRFFDTRMQQIATSSKQLLTVVTKEQTYLVVDYFARWRIIDPIKFYISTGGSVVRADTLLEQRLNDIVRAEYGKRTSNEAISTGRAAMMLAIQEQAASVGKDLGVSVTDVRIRQITLPSDVMGSVFRRMATERRQFAEAKRAEGIEKAEEIKSLADQQVTVIKAKALAEGAMRRAQGDQEAAMIYAKSYRTNRDFYAFYRSLLAYQHSFADKKDILLLKPDGQFFNYFHGVEPRTRSVGVN